MRRPEACVGSPTVNSARFAFGRVAVFAPDLRAREAELEIARCLSKAFSSGLWKASPMPVGPLEDPNSALGIVNGLGPRPVALAARTRARGEERAGELIGCVLGAVLNDEVIARYGLRPFSAVPGDALLAFIGIVPGAQHVRVNGRTRDECKVVHGASQHRSVSLARHLFESWLAMQNLHHCPHTFIRTRQQITPILGLCDGNRFSYCGRFELNLHGAVQERLVFRRSNAR